MGSSLAMLAPGIKGGVRRSRRSLPLKGEGRKWAFAATRKDLPRLKPPQGEIS